MSFSFEAKNELCRLPVQKLCCARAEAYGILLYCNTFSASEVRIITGNPALAARLPKLFHRAFGLRFDRLPEEGRAASWCSRSQTAASSAGSWTCWASARSRTWPCTSTSDCWRRSAAGRPSCGGVLRRGQRHGPGQAVPPGAGDLPPAGEPGAGGAAAGVRLSPKSVARNGGFITYFKQSDQIEDFLTLIGAPVAAMSVMSAKLEKDLRNSVNRRLNCDSANLDKAVEAAQEQLESIRKLQRAGLLDQAPDKLQLTAALRLENPELTLSELAEEFDPPVTKSCLNHRLRKITQLAKGL